MKHPMYNEYDSKITMPIVDSIYDNTKLENTLFTLARIAGLTHLPENEINSLITRALIFRNIPRDGHVLIKIDGDDWKSEISENTFRNLKCKDFKLPFISGAISMDNNTIFFSKVTKEEHDEYHEKNPKFFVKEIIAEDTLNISVLNNKTGFLIYNSIRESDFLINDKIVDNEVSELISIGLSALLYTAFFKNDITRVEEKSIYSKKNSKLRSPKHKVNIIKLKQKNINVYEGSEKNLRDKKNDKKWLVRGHWRNQYYKKSDIHKPKWIDPYWKGIENKEIVEKIYEIN